jgi:Tryptophan-associated transmembrane protein (Trp_oprn_chp)
MSRRSLALGSMLGGSVLALVLAWTGGPNSGEVTRAPALVALVGTVLVGVLGVLGRRVIGLLLAMLGVAMAVLGAVLSGSAAWARVGYAVGGVLIATGGVLTAITAARWPAPADRFSAKQNRALAATDDPAELWQAMDAGLDPTADPDVRNDDSGDTMRSAKQSQQSSRRK